MPLEYCSACRRLVAPTSRIKSLVITSIGRGASLMAVFRRVPDVALVALYPLSFDVSTVKGERTMGSSCFGSVAGSALVFELVAGVICAAVLTGPKASAQGSAHRQVERVILFII